MPTQSIIFTILGVVLYLCADALGDDVVVLNITLGDEAYFPMEEPTFATRCKVRMNTGSEFSLVPNERPPGITQNFNDEAFQSCGMLIPITTIDHRGEWTIRAFKTSNADEVPAIRHFELHFIGIDMNNEETPQLVEVFPSRSISIFPGNSMSFRLLNHYENLTSCIAILPNGETFDALNNANNEVSSDIRSFDQCGVIVRVNETHTGSWRLNATAVDDTSGKQNYFGTLYIQVEEPIAKNVNPSITYVQRGTSLSIRVGSRDAISCQLTNPSGRNLALHSGSCKLDIPVVTRVHQGLWTATYSLQGHMNLVQEAIEVIGYDVSTLNTSVTISSNGGVNLLCQKRAYSFAFCQFETPNGLVLNVFEGIGNGRYLYYGNGTQSSSMLTERVYECGITILKPDESDYGAWKCIIDTSSGLTGSVLRVPAPGYDMYENVVGSTYEGNVHVVKGDSFTVKCNANAELKYCWVGSPNGTAYLVSTTELSAPTTLRYVGMGLSLGECGAVIPAADDMDNGEWRCGMGIPDGREVGSIVNVTVTDTLLVPEVKNVTVQNGQVQLSWSLNPGYEQSISYCRWIHPSGFGLTNLLRPFHNQSQYTTYATGQSCHLEIYNLQRDWDTGEWTCVAGLVGSTMEVSATTHILGTTRFENSISSSRILSWYFGLAVGALSVIIAVILIVVLRPKLRFNIKPEISSNSEKSHMGFPVPPVTTSLGEPHFTNAQNVPPYA